jgi:acyl-CoA thioester hydrolase
VETSTTSGPREYPPNASRVTCELRFNDLDALGHVNHTVYHALLEEIRFVLLRPPAEMRGGFRFVLVRVELDHRAELRRFDGPIEIVGYIEHVGTKSVTLWHELLKRDGTVTATGRSILVAFDATTRRGREITAQEREYLDARRAA